MAKFASKFNKPQSADKTATPSINAPKPAPTRSLAQVWEDINWKIVAWVAGIAAAVLAVVLLVFGVLIYKYKSDSVAVKAVAGVVPYPVEIVGGSWVSYHEYLFELGSIKHYYLKQTGPDGKPTVDFNTADGKAKLTDLKKQIMDQLKSDTVTRQLIAKYKVTVSAKEVNDQVDQITKSVGGDASAADATKKVKQILQDYYGWTLDDLKGKVRFQLAKQKLQDKIATDDGVNAQAKAQAQDVLAKVKAGGDFGELAKQYSQDSTASNGGDLGFFGRGQMVKEFEDAAFALQPGQTSDLVRTKFGFHIIHVIEKKDDTVHAAHILIKSVDFDTYLKQQVDKAKTTVFFKV